MAVCGDVENRRGIILAKNQLAKRFGVITAETVWQAQKKCPDLVMVPPHHDWYAKYSKIVFEIYTRYTDLVESFGIDEAWLDVTGSQRLFGSGKEIADQIRLDVKREVGLTVSVGVSFNKVFAKLGSDYQKPDATTVISKENFQEIVYPLPVSELLYVGKVATATLEKLGIRTIGQLAEANQALLVNALGKFGAMIHHNAQGLDTSPVHHIHDQREVKSVGKGLTFKRNLVGMRDIKAGLQPLAKSVGERLREKGLKCSTIQVTIRDPDFKTITRQKKLLKATHLTTEIMKIATEIMKESWNLEEAIRMLTITGSNLVKDSSYEQLNLFDQREHAEREKLEKVEHLVDAIRSQFGRDVISYGVNATDLTANAKKSSDE